MNAFWCKCVVLAACLLIVFSSVSPAALAAGGETVYQTKLDALSDQLLDLQKKKDEVNQQITQAKNEKEKKLAEKIYWEEQISLARQEISVLQERIALLEEQIGMKTDEIDKKQADIDFQFDRYKKRLRANYMAGESSKLSMILGASNMSDLLMRSEVVRATAKHDAHLVEILNEDRERLEEAKADLDQSKRVVESDAAEMKEKRRELSATLTSTQNAIQDIGLMEQEYRARSVELEEMDKKVQAEIDAVYAKIDNSGVFVGGAFRWPLPGYSSLTSIYGKRFNNTNFHTGIDISGADVYGKKIVASNNGTVALVEPNYVEGVGYGKYVIVNHGGGYTTLYAHMSSISVSVGDQVIRGVTEIGKVGSTGWSTGPHIHFEVRIDGKHQNPMGFLKSKE